MHTAWQTTAGVSKANSTEEKSKSLKWRLFRLGFAFQCIGTRTKQGTVSLDALRQLNVSVQGVGGEGVEDKRLCCHTFHGRVSSLSQTKCFHHVKPWDNKHMTEAYKTICWQLFFLKLLFQFFKMRLLWESLQFYVWRQLVSPLTMLFLMVTSGHTATQEGSVESLNARLINHQYKGFFSAFSVQTKNTKVSLWALGTSK